MRRDLFFLAALALFATACGAGKVGEPDVGEVGEAISTGGSWEQEGYGPSRARVNLHESVISATNVAALSFAVNAVPAGTPSQVCVADGSVFVGTSRGFVERVDVKTGNVVWSYEAPGSIISAPAAAYGRVYVTSTNDALYIFSESTGERVAEVLFHASIAAYSPLIYDGRVYVTSADGRVYVVDARAMGERSTPLFSYEIPGSGAAIDGAIGYGSYYLPGRDNRVHAFPIAGCGKPTCTPTWSTDELGVMTAAPAIASDHIYAPINGKEVVALDAHSGALEWRSYVSTTHSPAVANGLVFLVDDTNVMRAIAETTGIPAWNAPLTQNAIAAPSVANGLVYATSGANDLTTASIDAWSIDCKTNGETCTPLFTTTFATNKKSAHAPVIANGMLLTSANGVEIFR